MNKDLECFWMQPQLCKYRKQYVEMRIWQEEEVFRLYGLSTKELNHLKIRNTTDVIKTKQLVTDQEIQRFYQQNDSIARDLKYLKQRAAINFLKQHPNSYVALDMVLLYCYLFGPDKPTYANMSEYMPYFGDTIKQTEDYQVMLHKYNTLKKLQVGNVAPDFKVGTAEGDSLSLSDLRGNVVLVNFWQSTCGWCNDQKQNLLDQYLQYQEQDFEVLNISFDESRRSWQNAVNSFGAPWFNYHEARGYDDSPIVKQYARPGIPFMMLVDKQGKIVATNLYAPQLARSEEQNLNVQLERVFN